ncbi:MAG: hypothetical protein AVDCRST_MAG59-3489, partial [uncultured Thermomicrobiales bacterium]
ERQRGRHLRGLRPPRHRGRLPSLPSAGRQPHDRGPGARSQRRRDAARCPPRPPPVRRLLPVDHAAAAVPHPGRGRLGRRPSVGAAARLGLSDDGLAEGAPSRRPCGPRHDRRRLVSSTGDRRDGCAAPRRGSGSRLPGRFPCRRPEPEPGNAARSGRDASVPPRIRPPRRARGEGPPDSGGDCADRLHLRRWPAVVHRGPLRSADVPRKGRAAGGVRGAGRGAGAAPFGTGRHGPEGARRGPLVGDIPRCGVRRRRL